MSDLSKIVYLSAAQYETLKTDGTITVGGTTINYSNDDLYLTPDTTVPSGGSSGQVLKKASSTDYDTVWSTPTEYAAQDASNLSSANVSSWASALGVERVETVYDKDSANSSINWGYTSGIGNGITVSSKDFSKYKRLRVFAQYSREGACTFDIDLKHLTPAGSYYWGGSVYETFWENNVQMCKFCNAHVNSAKTSISISCGILATSGYSSTAGQVVMIEGIY